MGAPHLGHGRGAWGDVSPLRLADKSRACWRTPEGVRARGSASVYVQSPTLFPNAAQIPDASAVGAGKKNVSTNMPHTFAVSVASGGRIVPNNT